MVFEWKHVMNMGGQCQRGVLELYGGITCKAVYFRLGTSHQTICRVLS